MTNKFFLIILLLIFSFPFLASAETYVRSPSGFSITSPINITAENVLNWESIGDCHENLTGDWFIFIDLNEDGSNYLYSSNFPYNQMSASINFNLPVGTEVWSVGYGCNGGRVGSYEGNDLDIIFKIISNGFSFNLPSNSVSLISDTSTGTVASVWKILQLLIGLPIGFYILRKFVINDLLK